MLPTHRAAKGANGHMCDHDANPINSYISHAVTIQPDLPPSNGVFVKKIPDPCKRKALEEEEEIREGGEDCTHMEELPSSWNRHR